MYTLRRPCGGDSNIRVKTRVEEGPEETEEELDLCQQEEHKPLVESSLNERSVVASSTLSKDIREPLGNCAYEE